VNGCSAAVTNGPHDAGPSTTAVLRRARPDCGRADPTVQPFHAARPRCGDLWAVRRPCGTWTTRRVFRDSAAPHPHPAAGSVRRM